MGKWMYSATTS